MTRNVKIRSRQRLGKYRIEKLLAQGGFADVYRAYDTIEGIFVALKVPQPDLLSHLLLEDFKKEVRLTAKLDHPNILPIKNASFIDEHFVIAYPLGEGTLGDRLRRRISFAKAFDFAEQLLSGLAHAHAHRVIHCDVKPENLILFPGHRLRLTDFGLAKATLRTMNASGSGTIGYMAPEQAMGRPSFRSDVFSVALILYRMFAGTLHEWPFHWPPEGFDKVRRKLPPKLIEVIRCGLELDPSYRFADAQEMLDALHLARPTAMRKIQAGKTRKEPAKQTKDWREVRIRQFQRSHKDALETKYACAQCKGPVAEAMQACPWCGKARKKHEEKTRLAAQCPRCRRGVKRDWKYCPWCYGARIGPLTERSYKDKRYQRRCANGSCSRRELLPFMRFCPWCRTKVKRPWILADTKDRCGSCGWGVLRDFWRSCPWCTKTLKAK